MNYLAHLALSPEHPQQRLGNFYGDFVRGRLETLANHYPHHVLEGIRQHRLIDRFTDDHPLVLECRQLLSPERRRFAGIMLDMLFDHLLIQHWDHFQLENRQQMISGFYRLLRSHSELHPPRLRNLAPRLMAEDWLNSYEDLDTVGFAIERIATRFSRPTTLRGAQQELEQKLPQLERRFLAFFPLLQSYAASLWSTDQTID